MPLQGILPMRFAQTRRARKAAPRKIAAQQTVILNERQSWK